MTPGRKLLFAVVALTLGLAGLELGARLSEPLWSDPGRELDVAGQDLETEWLSILASDVAEPGAAAALYRPDPRLFWGLRPGVRLELSNVVYETRGEPVTWQLEIDDQGRRGRAPSERAKPRVIALGDSCTFGWRVDQDATYPAQLESILAGRDGGDAGVLNLGVPGYSSHQGRLLLEQVLAVEPADVVVIAFGANDGERDVVADHDKPTGVALAGAGRLLDRLAIGRALRRLLGLGASGKAATDPEQMVVRVPLDRYEDNLRAMVATAQSHGAEVILADLVFAHETYREVIAGVAEEYGCAWIDGRAVLRAGLAELGRGGRLEAERVRLDKFWSQRVKRYRMIYFDQARYEELQRDEEWRQLLRYLLVEPVHANRVGNRLIAEAIAGAIRASRAEPQ